MARCVLALLNDIINLKNIFIFFAELFLREKRKVFKDVFFSSYKWINSIQIFISNRTWFSKFFEKKILFLKKSIWMCFVWHENQKKMSSEICWSSEINKINKSRCKTATIDHLNGFLPIYPESWFYWNEILIPNQMYQMYQFWHNWKKMHSYFWIYRIKYARLFYNK